MVVSIVLERNPELEFQDKVDLDRLVKEAFHEFQKDERRLKGTEKQVSGEDSLLENVSSARLLKCSLILPSHVPNRSTEYKIRMLESQSDLLEELIFLFS